jgi:hypothetical protein
MTKCFGYDNSTMERVPVPVGEECSWCDELIDDNDEGVFIPHVGEVSTEDRPLHIECFIRSIAGSVGHQLQMCNCFGGDYEDPPGLSVREAAKAAFKCQQAINKKPRTSLMITPDPAKPAPPAPPASEEEFKVESGIPLPERHRKWPWNKMKPGDSFFSPGEEANRGHAVSSANAFAKTEAGKTEKGDSWKFVSKMVEENGVKGFRIWRLS